MDSWTLKQPVQCANCPWKVGSDLSAIHGYSRQQHEGLKSTIAVDTGFNVTATMACHNSGEGHENMIHCVGWLANQLGPGNNIPLRIQARHCTNMGELQIVGPQHKTFEDTLS
jgi:hypothetical protein